MQENPPNLGKNKVYGLCAMTCSLLPPFPISVPSCPNLVGYSLRNMAASPLRSQSWNLFLSQRGKPEACLIPISSKFQRLNSWHMEPRNWGLTLHTQLLLLEQMLNSRHGRLRYCGSDGLYTSSLMVQRLHLERKELNNAGVIVSTEHSAYSQKYQSQRSRSLSCP